MAWVYVSLGGALLVVIGIVIVGFVAWPDRGEWYPHETPSGPVMRRHVNGKNGNKADDTDGKGKISDLEYPMVNHS